MIEGESDHTEDGEDDLPPAAVTATPAPAAPAQNTPERDGGLMGALLIAAGLAVAAGGGWYIATHVLGRPAPKRRKSKKS